MGAQKSIHAGKAKIDVNVDFTHKLCASLMLPPPRNTSSPLSLVIGSLCIKHPNLFGGSEKLDVSWDKGLYDSNVLVAYRRPRPEWLSQQCFVIQHSLSPEVGVHGLPIDNFSRSGSGGVNLSRLSLGLDISEPISSKWSNTTSLKFEFSMQIEQGIPVLSKWLIFNRFKFVASKGVKLGPAFLLTSLTGGSIVGDMAPYQAFAIGGLGSVRGYGEGAVGSGRSCLVANTELTFPLNNMLEGAVFMDCGTDLGSGRLVPGNPALRQGKPGSGAGLGYGLRYRSPFGSLQLDCAINAFQQKTLYFGITNLAS
ncbi:Outer envelope protein 39 [Citrus sinensis]|nr:Outer envelope protein 39 [Citrus sinensis]